jgi:hypothetical protein
MWKVKRMNTARIVVLTTAGGAGGIASYFASGSDGKPLPTEPVGQLQAPSSHDRDLQPGDNLNAIRNGVSSTTTLQK